MLNTTVRPSVREEKPFLVKRFNEFISACFFKHFITYFIIKIQSGLNISEFVILTNSKNDTDLVGTNFFQRYFKPL